jgi:hypothetical protein
MEGRRGAYRVLVGKHEGKHLLEGLRIDGRIILKLIFKKWARRHGLDSFGSREGQVAGWCERNNEPSGSIKCGEFLG